MHTLRKNRPLRRIVLASAATVSGMVLLLSLKPHTPPAAGGFTYSPAPSSGASTPRGVPGRGGSVSGTRTLTGDRVRTRYGSVQVRVTLEDGRLTGVTAVVTPQENPKDRRISAYAVPRLTREAVTAQSADIDTVSGATYTSEGYRRSLQSALDSASR
ncbi:FMN-binding protein [Streptomyces sp. F63]|uniref:FMN-binding protein n=1 Tax=Streptomyces sp. F63 TaxID=2824887 RepID=UPI001B35C60C|nr:FMN-binding protein [Streptomyces sp. F63]MBQ0987797.1 FMN-binding protein [Streptomyces sp. F63]